MHHYLSTAIRAVRQASYAIIRDSRDLNQLKIKKKPDGTFLTSTDLEVEKHLISILHDAYPEHDIFSEESGWSYRRDSPFVWQIDPIDGTHNFIHGVPHYAISVALMEMGIVTHSVVYDPNLNEMFTASRGSGAFLNDRRIRVSTCAHISQSCISLCTHTASKYGTGHDISLLKALDGRVHGVRITGSAALSLCYVASGRFDACCGENLKIFDIAAGSLLVTEAGGIASELIQNKKQNYLESGNILASSPKLATILLKILRESIEPTKL